MSNIIYINYYTNLIPKNKYSISGFDLDYTIIKTKSGNVFPKDKNDWKLWDQSVKNKFIELSKKQSNIIVIFSNQKGIGSNNNKFVTIKDFQDKIHDIRQEIGVDFIFIAAFLTSFSFLLFFLLSFWKKLIIVDMMFRTIYSFIIISS
jgi:DNA 3'-phosphatase